MAPRTSTAWPLNRRLPRELHRSQGVDMCEGTGLAGLKSDGAAAMATLEDGSSRSFDAVVVGIGVRPEASLAESAGLDTQDGILVDAFGRTDLAPKFYPVLSSLRRFRLLYSRR
ncbi:FAD-dependent oxidoreductase [Rhizobium phaseoli]